MAVKRKYRLNLRNYGNLPAIMLSQYDEGYALEFEIRDGTDAASDLSAYTVTLKGTRADTLAYSFSGTIATNVLTFVIDTTMTACDGRGTAEIAIKDTANDVLFATFNMPVFVERAAVPEGSIDADVERAQEIAEQVQEIVDNAAAAVSGEAEKWATGQIDGTDVPSTDPTYENNAKYYAEQAADSAASIGIDATLTQTGKAADAKKTGDEITALKEGLAQNLVTLDEHKIYGYLIYPQTNGFYSAPNGAVGRYEIEKGESYIFNFNGSYILSNKGIIEQYKEVCDIGSGFINTDGYKYLFINSVQSDGTTYGRTVKKSKQTSVIVGDELKGFVEFDSDPQEQITYWNADKTSDVTLTAGKGIIAVNTSGDFGNAVNAENCTVTDYIVIKKCDQIEISVGTNTVSTASVGIVFYDVSKTPVRGIRYAGSSQSGNNEVMRLTPQSGEVYVRSTIWTDTENKGAFVYRAIIAKDLMFNELSNIHPFVPYRKVVRVAASDASADEKKIADFVCDGTNDEVEIQGALNTIDPFHEGYVMLSAGTFNIDAFPIDATDKYIALKVASGSPTRKHIVGAGRFRNSMTIINVTSDALTALGDDYGVVFGTTDFVYARSVVYENFYVYLADNQHKVTVIDNTGIASGMCNDLSLSAVPANISNTINTPMPDEDCIGITGYCGDDAGTYNEMNRVFATGFYEGFRLGGEHLVCKNLGARFNYYSYTFGNYDWKIGTQSHPITLINCCDEHSACLPKFVRCGNYDQQTQLAKQEVNLIDFNMELARSSNFGGGFVTPAEEVTAGAFCGRIDFTANGGSNVSGASNPSPGTTNNPNVKFWGDGSGEFFITRNMVHPLKGTTAQRNFVPAFMQQYFDTTLNKMLIYDGTEWIDMNGNAVE